MAMAKKTPKKLGRKQRRRLAGLALSLLALAVFIYLTITLLPDSGTIKRVFSGRAHEELASEFSFTVGKNRSFANLGDGIAAVGSLGVQVLSRGGDELLRDVFQTVTPAVTAENGRAVAYDIGGTALRVFNSGEILHAVETSGPIVSADINKNGWFCVSVQEGGGYKGSVTVYNSKGKSVYKFDSAEGYVLDAAIHSDNKTMAVLTLAQTGSRVTLYNLSDETPAAQFSLDGGLIIDIKYMSDGKILAFTKTGIILIGKNGTGETLYDFEGRVIRAYAQSGGIIAVYLLDYGVGSHGRLVVLGLKGETPAILETDREIIGMSVREKTLAVLHADGLSVYDSTLNLTGEEISDGGTGTVLVLEGGILTAGDNSARVIRRAE